MAPGKYSENCCSDITTIDTADDLTVQVVDFDDDDVLHDSRWIEW